MKVESHYAGAPLKPFYTDILARHTMNYAAAINDNNPKYFDDELGGGIVAHPMNSVAMTWPILERVWEYIDVEDFPRDILATQVHFSEQLILHQPVRPGDKLVIRGKIAAILPHRVGTHMIIQLDAFKLPDAAEGADVKEQEGELVFTEYIGGLMRGVECADQGKGLENIPTPPKTHAEGPPLWEKSVEIDPMLPFIYDGCTDIHFPIHTSKAFAHMVGLPDIIVQGTATLALAVKEVINQKAGANPNLVKSIACRFTGMVLPGSAITVQLLDRNDEGDVFFQVLNTEGKRAINHGHIKLAL